MKLGVERSLSCSCMKHKRAEHQFYRQIVCSHISRPLSVSLRVSLVSPGSFRRSHRLTALPKGEPDVLRFSTLPAQSALPNASINVAPIPPFFILNSSFFIAFLSREIFGPEWNESPALVSRRHGGRAIRQSFAGLRACPPDCLIACQLASPTHRRRT